VGGIFRSVKVCQSPAMLNHRNPCQWENKQGVYDAGYDPGLKAYMNSPSLSIRLCYQGRKM
jgi:hypothetical protein